MAGSFSFIHASLEAVKLPGEFNRCERHFSSPSVSSAFFPKTEAAIIAVKPGWAEQNPESWWENLKLATQAVMNESGAKIELEAAINATEIHAPKCPVYQIVDALPHTDPEEIKKNLVAQLTASVRWTQTVKNMVADGATDFTECGPGAVLQGLIKKIAPEVSAHGIA